MRPVVDLLTRTGPLVVRARSFMTMSALPFVVSCGGHAAPTDATGLLKPIVPVVVSRIVLSSTSFAVGVGRQRGVEASVYATDGSRLNNQVVAWQTSDSSVVRISGGSSGSNAITVTAVGVGVAEITASAGYAETSIVVQTVAEAPAPNSIVFQKF